MSEHAMREHADSATQDVEQRVSYLDVVEQQLLAMRSQAQSTIASCDSALVTIRLLKSQLDSARKLADERRQQETAAPKQPATFGRHRRPSDGA